VSKAWRRRTQKDPYRRRAQAEGYRSRAAYKLKEIATRHGVVQPGDVVVDLGAAPGGWSQIAIELVGPKGRVIAVDVKPMEPLPGVLVMQGDVTRPETQALIRETTGTVDVVLSDMAPRISGAYAMDHAKSIALAETALDAALQVLRPGGRFAVKVFQGDMFKRFYDRVGRSFEEHRALRPAATRKGSSEVYVLGFGRR